MARRVASEACNAFTLLEHRDWVKRLWARMNRVHSDEITAQDLNCDEFHEVLHCLLAPRTAGVALGHGRSAKNCAQAIHFCLSLADQDHSGSLDFEEFEKFLRDLRNCLQNEADSTKLIFALFDIDTNNTIGMEEFREIYRFFLGHDPTSEEFTVQWSRLDPEGNDQATRQQYTRWLRHHADPIFSVHAPRIVDQPKTPQGKHEMNRMKGSISFSGKSRASRRVFLPAPGLTPPSYRRSNELPPPAWNENWASKDPSIHNEHLKGNFRFRSFFSRPQSLPELQRFFISHTGFEKYERRLCRPEPAPPKLVLSTDTKLNQTAPGLSRHRPGGIMRNSKGEVILWQENSPRSHKKVVWEPGSLLLRVPGAPPAFLVKGRDAED